MGRYIAICSICDEGTNEPYHCAICGAAFCPDCEEANLSEQGNGIDDIKSVCVSCITEKVGA